MLAIETIELIRIFLGIPLADIRFVISVNFKLAGTDIPVVAGNIIESVEILKVFVYIVVVLLE
jgi:hypothetical protein